ncbi:hypothetical protein RDWZM_008453 [Blomia tropicalis]|uniref:Uncharacterized protein n=1 Tax=Blomia tropicalis TaxID=40697 RepID=A0A9Q0RK35_BLOTA|nr:hypothetical protein RDWZM_008453 [Blomia tropicalis]
MDAHQSLTTKRYLFCQQCLAFRNSNREFYFTQCMKTFCRNCLAKDPKYHKCSSECRIKRICNDMPEDLKTLFQDPGTSMKRNIHTYEFMFKQYNVLTTNLLNMTKQQSDKMKSLYKLTAKKDVEIKNLKELYNAQIAQKDAEIEKLKKSSPVFLHSTPFADNSYKLDDDLFQTTRAPSSKSQIHDNLDEQFNEVHTPEFVTTYNNQEIPREPLQFNEVQTSKVQATRNIENESLNEFFRQFNEGATSSSNFQIRENLDVPPGPPQLNEPRTSNQIPIRNNQDEHLHEFLRPYNVRQISPAGYLTQSNRNERVSAPPPPSLRGMNERRPMNPVYDIARTFRRKRDY